MNTAVGFLMVVTLLAPGTYLLKTEECLRDCDGTPKTCYFKIHVEPYSTMGPACGDCPQNKTACYDPQCITADGVEKGILVYNRKLPGTPIQVCRGDKVIVDLVNSDSHRSTSVHWHGVRHIGSQHYDGVPMVTQCPINPGQTFRYKFYATDPGTFFYHSHSGVQKIDGLSGPLIVRDKRLNEIYGHLYDNDLSEHVMYIQDWTHGLADEKVPGKVKGANSGSLPDSYLINGKGIYVEGAIDPKLLIPHVNSPSQPPISEFKVKYGQKYRFRILGSSCMACTFKVTVQGHKMIVINADGAGPVTPTAVDAVGLNSGDRFDVIIEANNKVDVAYWILVRGQGGSCANAMQLAVLRYGDHSAFPTSNLPLDLPGGVTLNPMNPTCTNPKEVCLTQLTSPHKAPPTITQAITKERFLFQFGFHVYSKKELFQSDNFSPYFEPVEPLLVRGQINSITNKVASSPILSQYHDIPASAKCSKKCQQEHLDCVCLNLYTTPLNTVVDIIIADSSIYTPDGLTHPFHLHGYNFYILREGIFTNGIANGIRELNNWLDKGPMVNLTNAIQKDSIGIPAGGYAVIRLFTDNPGFWILHCHFTLHLDLGMSAVLQVGDLSDMAPTPPGFPKCGDFLPPIS